MNAIASTPAAADIAPADITPADATPARDRAARAAERLSNLPKIKFVKIADITADLAFNRRDEKDYDRKDPDMVNLAASMKAFNGNEDPVIISRTAAGTNLLDAGFRRYVTGDRLGLKVLLAIVYLRESDDPKRRDANAFENAKKALSWQSQARLAITMSDGMGNGGRKLSDDEIAKRMVVDKKHVQLLLRVARKIDELIATEKIPAEPAAELNLNEARELVQFSKSEVEEAWNAFQRTGRFPDREKMEEKRRAQKEADAAEEGDGEGGGDSGGGGERKKGRKELMLDLRKSVPWIDFGALVKCFPPKSTADVQLLANFLNANRRRSDTYDVSRNDNDPSDRTWTCNHGKKPMKPCWHCGEKGASAPPADPAAGAAK